MTERRLFFGIPLHETSRVALTKATRSLVHAENLRPLRPRWTRPEGWHCTMKFVGSTSAEGAEALIAAAPGLPCPPSIDTRWGGFGAFPSPRRARVLVAHLEDAEGTLTELARLVEELTTAHGVAPEARPFRPHVTLARFQCPANLGDLCATEPLTGSVTLGPLTLFESHLGAGGSRYEALWPRP